MRKAIFLITLLFLSFSFLNAQTPAFPGAEGYGRYTVGGRGGKVVRVTTLEDNASTEALIKGSLRWALDQSGPKTIVFDVSGTIKLKQDMKTRKDFLTIAGQTAPGDGICIADYAFVINSNDVILRYLRFRVGEVGQGEPDGLGGMDKKNIIVDHCSISWSVDEGLSVYGMENSTVQWSLVSEALRQSSHAKGTHCYGGNWGGNKASYHHNIIAHCESRVPRLGPRPSTQNDEYVDIRNNVFYNWAGEGCYGGEAQKVNIVNNYYKPGPATDKASSATKYRIAKIGVRTAEYVTKYTDFAPTKHIWGKFYIDGNKIEGNPEVSNDNWPKGVYAQQTNGTGVDNLWTQQTKDTIKLTEPLDIALTTNHSADLAYERVLEYTGCCLIRDEVDARIIDDVKNRKASFTGSGNKAGYINTPFDTKPSGAGNDWTPWPELKQGVAPTDSNNDGIPDGWLEANYPGKKATDKNVEGYTYFEMYLESLVQHITASQNAGGTISSLNPLIESELPVVNMYLGADKILNVFSEKTIQQINAYNVLGTKTTSVNVQANNGYIDTTEMPTGVYLLHIFCADYTYPVVKKIII